MSIKDLNNVRHLPNKVDQGSRKPDLIGAAIITMPTSHTHSFVQVMNFINRKDKTIVFLSSETKSLSLCSVYLVNSNATVVTPNNSVQAIFYYITRQMVFITISRFIKINNVKLNYSYSYYVECIYLIANIATWTYYKANNTITK